MQVVGTEGRERVPCQRQLRGAAEGWAHRETERGVAGKFDIEIRRTKASA